MPRGENTILRESDKPMRTLQKLIKHHPTDMEVLQAQIQLPGHPFYADGHTYRIVKADRDDMNRLIAIGELTEVPSAPPAKEYPILYPIYGGKWHAAGDGWAVAGDTPEEARENYHKAELQHQEILARPPRQKE